MINRNNKKGFTIVELVIVIAVIAILAAVLIPTFAGIINKAHESADIQAVRQMNTALAVDAVTNETDIFGVYDVLAEAGMDAEDYKPLAKDKYFFWSADKKCIVYTDKNYTVVYPEEHAGSKYVAGTSKWFSLSMSVEGTAITGFTNTSTAVNVTSGEQMVWLLDQINNGEVADTLTITVDGTIDMMGATFSIPEVTKDIILQSEKDANGKYTGVIKNATSVDTGFKGDGATNGYDGQYSTGLFGEVNPGASLKIIGVTFDNINVKNTHAGNVAILVAANGGETAGGTVTIEDVTISNSTVIGHRTVGALMGHSNNALTLSGSINLTNVNVKTVGGRSGLLIGNVASGGLASFNDTSTITVTKSSLSMYECEQNTGKVTINETEYNLGPVEGKITSWAYDGTGAKTIKGPYDFDATKYNDGKELTYNNIVKN